MTTYAIVETGGKQYRVSQGDVLDVDRMPDRETGDTVTLDKIVLVNRDDSVTVGKPYVDGAKVVAKLVGQIRDKKVVVFKYKRKVRYRRKTGHRQSYSRIQIESIE